MPYKDYFNPKNIAYRKAYYLKRKNDPVRKEQRKQALKKWRSNNKLKVNAYIRSRYDPEKAQTAWQRVAKRESERCNKKTELLTEAYMIKHLKKIGYTLNEIKDCPELIDTYRIIIKTKRLWKKLQTLKTLEKV